MKIHLLGLAHTKTNKDWSMCAYTQKVYKLARMLANLGYHVIHYGAEGSDVPCEHVSVIDDETWHLAYGDYDWHKEFFKHSPDDLAYRTFNQRASAAILERKEDDDVLLVSFGNYQKPIADAVKIYRTVEMGIGYTGVFADFKIFESYAWMHHIYGLLKQQNGTWYDSVIPNFFDPDDFPYSGRHQDYFLFIGRLAVDKGVQIAIDTARIVGKKLVIAGQGSLDAFNREGVDIEFVGSVGPTERAKLMAGAIATLVPTWYLEPFGGVAVESMLCGTPAITSDWGAFPETVRHGITGYRCRTMDDFVAAGQRAGGLRREECRRWALANYAMSVVAGSYQRYFERLANLSCGGWYFVQKKQPAL